MVSKSLHGQSVRRPTNADFYMLCTEHSPLLTTLLKQLGIAMIYALLVWVVLAYITPSGGGSIFFLASGFALAVLLLGGKRYAWGILFGALGVNLLFGGYPWATVLLKSGGSTLGALLGAWLLMRDGKFDRSLPTLDDHLRLVVLGGFAGGGLSAAIGATSLLYAGMLNSETYGFGMFAWWLGDVLGVILLTPLCLLWWRRTSEPVRPALPEAWLITGVTFLAGQVIFMEWFHASIGHVARSYWMFLFMVWAAIRLNTRWVILLLAMTAIQAVWGAYLGMGYFAHDLELTHLSNYWFFMIILSLVGMTLSIHLAQRRQAETALRQRTDELDLHNRILQQINQGNTLPHVLHELARGVEHFHPEMLCAIFLRDEDGRHLRHGAAPGLPDFYNQALDGLAIGEGEDACATAALRGERVMVEDMRQHPLLSNNAQFLARRAGVQSCWAQPIKDGKQRVLGIFAIYHAYPAQPSSAEIGLLEHMANLTARAIEKIHIQGDLRLKDAALAASADAIVIFVKSGQVVWANPAFGKLTGYGLDESIGRNIRDLVKSRKQDRAYYQSLWASILAGDIWHGELFNRHKDGTEYDQDMTITPVKNAAADITHFVCIMRDISERKQAEEQIRTLAFYDALTQLPNRRLLEDRLKQAMAASKRSGRYGAMMFLDLDNFKPLNDAHGHSIGDLLLSEVARRITTCVRSTDTVARFGGDEFVVLLDGLDHDNARSANQAASVAEKIRLALADPYVLTVRHEGAADMTVEHRCTASLGIALFISNETSADDILKCADQAMYAAKDAGRNQVRFYAAAV